MKDEDNVIVDNNNNNVVVVDDVDDDIVDDTVVTTIMNEVHLVRTKMQLLHDSCINHTYEWKYKQLTTLLQMIVTHEKELIQAIQLDLHCVSMEAYALQIAMIISEMQFFIRNLRSFGTIQKIPSPVLCAPAYSHIQPLPLNGPGILIIGPSNYPLSLVLQPTAGALAAGNPVIMKPSEHCPNVTAILLKYIPQYFPTGDVVHVVGCTSRPDNSGSGSSTSNSSNNMGTNIAITTQLLQVSWGKIFFTGSSTVGKIIATAAGKTLTPTVLELGGKSPCIIDPLFDNELQVRRTSTTSSFVPSFLSSCCGTSPGQRLMLLANRILWAKLMNAGQTCAAVDTLVCTSAMAQTLVPYLIQGIEQQYGKLTIGGYTLHDTEANITRIITKKNTQRLYELILECENAASVSEGGQEEEVTETNHPTAESTTRTSSSPLLKKIKNKNGTRCQIMYGGTKYCNVMNRYIAPTIVLNPPKNCLLMQQEIFGPILPIITIDQPIYDDGKEEDDTNNKKTGNILKRSHSKESVTTTTATTTTNTMPLTTIPETNGFVLSKTDIITIREKMIHYVKNQLPDPVSIPLCLYVFINDSTIFHNQYMNRIRSGSVMRNDCLVQLASPYIPFGGIGSSGNGTYHGTYSIQTFTQYVPYMYRPLIPGTDWNQLRYHPFVPGTWKYWLLTCGIIDKIPALPVLIQPMMFIVLAIMILVIVIPIIILFGVK